MLLYKLFIVSFISYTAFSLSAMENQQRIPNKSIKLITLAVNHLDIPQDTKCLILQKYVKVSLDNARCREIQETLNVFKASQKLEKYNSIKITQDDLINLVWFGFYDKLQSVRNAIKNGGVEIDETANNHKQASDYSEITSLPLWFRCKLGLYNNKSVKWPMLVLKQSNIPQELQHRILQNYVDISFDDKTCMKMQYTLDLFNNPQRLTKYNGTEINKANLMWLDSGDKLYHLRHAVQHPNIKEDLLNDTVNRDSSAYKETISLPLWFRCKLGMYNSKSAKWPILALKNTGLPQDLQRMILQQYIRLSTNQKNNPKLDLAIFHLNDKQRLERHNGAEITKQDVMWLDSHDKESLILAEKAISRSVQRDRAREAHNTTFQCVYEEELSKEKYDAIVSSPFFLRYKLGKECPMGVQAEKYDLRPAEKQLLFDRFFQGGSVGFVLYGTINIVGKLGTAGSGFFSFFALPMAFLSYVAGAGLTLLGSWLNLMKKKQITPDKPWVQEKYVCPEAHNPLHKLYWMHKFYGQKPIKKTKL